jgi:phage gpG-like protein
MSDDFDFDTKNLDALIKALKTNMKKVRVGILGGKTMRNNGGGQGPTNATIGAAHEFGTDKMPQRSFLRMPISENLQKELESHGAFTEDAAKRVIKEASFVPWLERLMAVGLKIVSDAFDTGGFGKWPAWKTPGYKNNTGQKLVDTQQLRNSITGDIR